MVFNIICTVTKALSGYSAKVVVTYDIKILLFVVQAFVVPYLYALFFWLVTIGGISCLKKDIGTFFAFEQSVVDGFGIVRKGVCRRF